MARVLRTAASLTLLACTLLVGGHAARAQRVTNESFTLALGGDVIFDAPIEYVLRARGHSAEDPASFEELFADLRGPLTAADFAIVNLETPVGPRVRDRSEAHDYPTFAAPPAFLDALARAGVDVVTVANNHAYDQGVAGLATTLSHAGRSHLTVTGTVDGDGYSLSRVRDVRVAIVSMTQGTNHRIERGEPAAPRVHFFDHERLVALVAHARARADVVLVALHFTDTGDHMPTNGMRRWARRAAEAGADLVVGHGPHVPASSEWIDVSGRRVLVLHSLGNLVAAMQAEAHAERTRAVHVRDSVIVSLRVSVLAGRVTIEPPRVSAYWIDDAHSPTGAAPFTRPIAIDASGDHALARRARRLAALFDTSHVEAVTVATAPSLAAATPTAPSVGTSPRETVPSPLTPAVRATAAIGQRGRAPSGSASTPPGEALGVVFRCGDAMEVSVDRASIDAWVARMREDRSLRAEVVSTRCEGESAALADRRARRASGLIAMRGPSRSRFTWRASEDVTDAPRIRVVPR
ncbi:MAG: CapA family protein [Deltaproteobacteria bacterium]|nr:CapA family protein [Deltaproteobacteria bacterium]